MNDFVREQESRVQGLHANPAARKLIERIHEGDIAKAYLESDEMQTLYFNEMCDILDIALGELVDINPGADDALIQFITVQQKIMAPLNYLNWVVKLAKAGEESKTGLKNIVDSEQRVNEHPTID